MSLPVMRITVLYFTMCFPNTGILFSFENYCIAALQKLNYIRTFAVTSNYTCRYEAMEIEIKVKMLFLLFVFRVIWNTMRVN